MEGFREIGEVSLTNSKRYPFNDSRQIVPLRSEAKDAAYFVLTELVRTDGDAGELVVSGKAENGFCIAFTGSAHTADIRYLVIGAA